MSLGNMDEYSGPAAHAAPPPPQALPAGGRDTEIGIVERLRERARFAREENTGTALGDANHFEEAAAEIDDLNAMVSALNGNVHQFGARIEALEGALAAADELVAVQRDYATMPFPDFEAKYGSRNSWLIFSEVLSRYVAARAATGSKP